MMASPSIFHNHGIILHRKHKEKYVDKERCDPPPCHIERSTKCVVEISM